MYETESLDNLVFSDGFKGDYAEWLLNKETKTYEVKRVENYDESYIYESELSDMEQHVPNENIIDDVGWGDEIFLNEPASKKIENIGTEETKAGDDDDDDEDDDDDDEDEDN